MPLYLGGTKIGELSYGGTSIGSAYYGSTLVYEKEPWYTSDLSGNKYVTLSNNTLSTTTPTYSGYNIDASDSLLTIIDGQIWYNKGASLVNSNRNFIYSDSSNYWIATPTTLYATNASGGSMNSRLTGSFTRRSLYFYNTKGLIGNNGSLNFVTLSAGYDPTISTSTFLKSYTSIMLPENFRTNQTCIIDGDLYVIGLSVEPYTLTLVDSGNWTDICGSYGIKNKSLYYINISDKSVVLKDNTETYSQHIMYCNSYYYAVTDSGTMVVCNGSTVTKNPSKYKKGRWDSVSTTTVIQSVGYAVGIRNGALYYFSGLSTFGLIDDTKFYTKCSGGTYFSVCTFSGNRILKT